jgi:hypothetical protein
LVRGIKVPASLIPKQSTSLNRLKKCFPNIYQYQSLFAWWAYCPYIWSPKLPIWIKFVICESIMNVSVICLTTLALFSNIRTASE